MKKRLIVSLVVGLVVIGLMGLSGCSKKSSDPDPLDVNGTWVIEPVGDAVMTAVLVHSGTVITGTVSTIPVYAVSISGFTTASAGATEPRTITLIVGFNDGRTSTLIGEVDDDNETMSGTYTDDQGGADTWVATRQ
jgi:hypothetical protein